jgi:hypothetical protein
MTAGARTLIAALLLVVALAGSGAAVEIWSDSTGDRSVSLDTSLKWTTLLSKAPDDTLLYPEEWSAASLWRMRLSVDARPTTWLSAHVAYEQRARALSEGAGAGGGAGVLPSEVPAPYRIEQLDDSLVEVGTTFSLRHELDRAFVSASLGPAELTLGRQAIGWGRGVVFAAVDVFAPFSPLEHDREWRRGIDAVRLSAPITDLISVDTVAAIGASGDESSYIGRVSGYVGDIDGEIFVGRRCEDDFYAASASFPLFDAEFHGEAAVFKLPAALPDGASFGTDDVALSGTVGGSRTFDLAAGLYVLAEYHYSGFGVADVEDAATLLGDDPDYLSRYIRGDMQVLGRHAAAAQLVYGFAGDVPLSLTWIVSPVDGSGVVMPALTWSFSDNVTLAGSVYLPHGAGSTDGVLGSEYGSTPVSGLLQMSFHY